MSTLTQLAGNAAPPHVFEVKDSAGHVLKSFPLRLIDDFIHAAWEKERLKRDREFIKDNKEAGMYSGSEYKEALDELSGRYADGYYSLISWFVEHADLLNELAAAQEGGKALTSALLAKSNKLSDGMTLLSSLIFQCPVPEMKQLMLKYGQEVASYVGLIIQESLPTDQSKPVEESGTPSLNAGAAVPNG